MYSWLGESKRGTENCGIETGRRRVAMKFSHSGKSTSLGFVGKDRKKMRRPERTKGLSLVERRKERNATTPASGENEL